MDAFDPRQLRRAVLRMAFAGSTVHIPCALSLVEILAVLYRNHLRYDRADPHWPVRDYHARVEFTPHDDGTTTVRWSGEFIERIPGTGWLWKRFLLRFLGDLADNLLIAAAEPSLDDAQRDAGPGPGRTADHA